MSKQDSLRMKPSPRISQMPSDDDSDPFASSEEAPDAGKKQSASKKVEPAKKKAAAEPTSSPSTSIDDDEDSSSSSFDEEAAAKAKALRMKKMQQQQKKQQISSSEVSEDESSSSSSFDEEAAARAKALRARKSKAPADDDDAVSDSDSEPPSPKPKKKMILQKVGGFSDLSSGSSSSGSDSETDSETDSDVDEEEEALAAAFLAKKKALMKNKKKTKQDSEETEARRVRSSTQVARDFLAKKKAEAFLAKKRAEEKRQADEEMREEQLASSGRARARAPTAHKLESVAATFKAEPEPASLQSTDGYSDLLKKSEANLRTALATAEKSQKTSYEKIGLGQIITELACIPSTSEGESLEFWERAKSVFDSASRGTSSDDAVHAVVVTRHGHMHLRKAVWHRISGELELAAEEFANAGAQYRALYKISPVRGVTKFIVMAEIGAPNLEPFHFLKLFRNGYASAHLQQLEEESMKATLESSWAMIEQYSGDPMHPIFRFFCFSTLRALVSGLENAISADDTQEENIASLLSWLWSDLVQLLAYSKAQTIALYLLKMHETNYSNTVAEIEGDLRDEITRYILETASADPANQDLDEADLTDLCEALLEDELAETKLGHSVVLEQIRGMQTALIDDEFKRAVEDKMSVGPKSVTPEDFSLAALSRRPIDQVLAARTAEAAICVKTGKKAARHLGPSFHSKLISLCISDSYEVSLMTSRALVVLLQAVKQAPNGAVEAALYLLGHKSVQAAINGALAIRVLLRWKPSKNLIASYRGYLAPLLLKLARSESKVLKANASVLLGALYDVNEEDSIYEFIDEVDSDMEEDIIDELTDTIMEHQEENQDINAFVELLPPPKLETIVAEAKRELKQASGRGASLGGQVAQLKQRQARVDSLLDDAAQLDPKNRTISDTRVKSKVKTAKQMEKMVSDAAKQNKKKTPADDQSFSFTDSDDDEDGAEDSMMPLPTPQAEESEDYESMLEPPPPADSSDEDDEERVAEELMMAETLKDASKYMNEALEEQPSNARVRRITTRLTEDAAKAQMSAAKALPEGEKREKLLEDAYDDFDRAVALETEPVPRRKPQETEFSILSDAAAGWFGSAAKAVTQVTQVVKDKIDKARNSSRDSAKPRESKIDDGEEDPFGFGEASDDPFANIDSDGDDQDVFKSLLETPDTPIEQEDDDAEEAGPTESPVFSVGDTITAQWNEDQQWYLAEITNFDAEDNLYTVVFTEYGNADQCRPDQIREEQRDSEGDEMQDLLEPEPEPEEPEPEPEPEAEAEAELDAEPQVEPELTDKQKARAERRARRKEAAARAEEEGGAESSASERRRIARLKRKEERESKVAGDKTKKETNLQAELQENPEAGLSREERRRRIKEQAEAKRRAAREKRKAERAARRQAEKLAEEEAAEQDKQKSVSDTKVDQASKEDSKDESEEILIEGGKTEKEATPAQGSSSEDDEEIVIRGPKRGSTRSRAQTTLETRVEAFVKMGQNVEKQIEDTMQEGLKSVAADMLDRALGKYSQALSLDPKSKIALIAKAKALARKAIFYEDVEADGFFRKSMDQFETAVALHDDPETITSMLQMMLARSKFWYEMEETQGNSNFETTQMHLADAQLIAEQSNNDKYLRKISRLQKKCRKRAALKERASTLSKGNPGGQAKALSRDEEMELKLAALKPRLKVGRLNKQGGGKSAFGRKTWKPRCFELTEKKLLYYTKSATEKPLGSIDLSEVITVANTNVSGRSYCFEVSAASRSYPIEAATNAERKEWVESIQNNCDRIEVMAQLGLK